jgi:phthalate 4,5-dioxygenase
MKADQNKRLTQVGPHSPCGDLLRLYWQPVALLDEFNAQLDPKMQERPLKAVRVFGEDLVLFKDHSGRFGLIDKHCAHRGVDLSFARYEGDGVRCPFHGWKFDVNGHCLDTPAEPTGSRLKEHIQQRHYPVIENAGVIFAWMGPPNQTPPPFPRFDCFEAPASHSFAFKGRWKANWLQAFEVGIDPAHPSFLHRFLQDEDLQSIGDNDAGKQFRSASAGEINGQKWPMTRIMREFCQPNISFESKPYGMEITSLRSMNEELTHVRVTQAIFPATFVIPLSESLSITQFHVPVDDEHTYWYSFFTSFDKPLNKEAMRAQRLQFISLPDYIPKSGAHNHWGFNAKEQVSQTYLGMGEEDINVHDQWAVESMGPIQDRTQEHLGTSDVLIMANRRVLLKAIEDVQNGASAPGVSNAHISSSRFGPDIVDGVAPSKEWSNWWRAQVKHKQEMCQWLTDELSVP